MSAANRHIKNLFEVQNFQADLQQIWVVKISIHGRYLATGGKTGILKIFELLNFYSDNLPHDINQNNVKEYLNFVSEDPYRAFSEHSNDIIDICWSNKVIDLIT